jgi:multiple sugar transport system ATP-binding protein
VPGIRLDDLTKSYAQGSVAVDHLSLDIADGEFMVLVGPSGCGKSTLMRMIAGIEEVTSGTIHLGDRDVTHVDPKRRDLAMVFQNYALYPHMTVRDNIAFGLKLRGTPKRDIGARVGEVAAILGLQDLLKRKPSQLSGGQRQRVAMGRAIAREPQAFLMDEPLSNLDAKLRVAMRAQLVQLHERLSTTTVYVTHDQVEAMTLGDRVAVLRGGTLQQCDRPETLFARPANLFVAAFIGSPAMNLVEADVRDGVARFGGCEVPLVAGSPLHGLADGRIVLGVRPHDLELAGEGAAPELPTLDARVEVVERLGTETHIVFAVDAPRVEADELREALDQGDDATAANVLLGDDARAQFTATVDPRARVSQHETVRIAIDPHRLHAFDCRSGAVLSGRSTAAPPDRQPRPATR